jgi:hypothetical protein
MDAPRPGRSPPHPDDQQPYQPRQRDQSSRPLAQGLTLERMGLHDKSAEQIRSHVGTPIAIV